MPEQDQEVGAIFPTSGLDVTTEYGRQPADTTPAAVNVMSFDVFLDRLRGGSRPGLSKYIDETVNGDSPVQHLNILVDPRSPALNADAADELVPDPSTNNLSVRNPGRTVRQGGSGRQPNRNTDVSASSSFVQKKHNQNGVTNSAFDTVLDTQPTTGDLIVVIVRTEKNGGSAELVDTVRNANLSDFTQADAPGVTSDSTTNLGGGDFTDSLSVWYRVASEGANETTVTVDPGSTGAIYEVCILVYRGWDTLSPFTDREINAASSDTYTVAGLTLDGTTDQLVICAFDKVNNTTSGIEAGYVARFGVNGDPGSEAANMIVVDNTTASGVTEDISVTTLIVRDYCGFAVSFTR